MSVRNFARWLAAKLDIGTNVLRVGAWRFPRARPKVVQCEINGFRILVLANEDVGKQILLLRRYERDDSAFLRGLLKPADICIDVGANIGYYSLLMAQAAEKGEVHAFEPDGLNSALVAASVQLNGYANVRIVRAAVGDSDGSTAFARAADGAYSSIHDTGRVASKDIARVDMMSLDSYVRKHGLPRIDVLKVDVEGAEGMVIEGARQILADAQRRPRVVMLELYDQNLQAFDQRVETVVETMRGFSYEPRFVDAATSRPFERQHYNTHYNVFFVLSGS